jgi:excisionase family DNA binding protein
LSETTLPITLLADALGVSTQDLLHLVRSSASAAPDATLVALTVEEAARRLGVGRTTMYALLASGEIPSMAIGRLRRVPADALAAYVAARSQTAPSTAALAA